MKKLAFALLLSSALIGAASAVTPTTPVGNANYTALSTDQRIQLTTAFTAPRTITLNSAGATCIGQTCGASSFEILDGIGAVSGTNTLTIAPASGETINGSSASIVISEPFLRVVLVPISGSNWVLQIYAPGQYPGTTTNDNAPAGSLGEFNSSVANSSNAISGGVTSAPAPVSNVATVLTQNLLSAGDWDCRGTASLAPNAAAAITAMTAWTSIATAVNNGVPIPTTTTPAAAMNPSFVALQAASVTSPTWSLATAPMRFSLSAATSVYLNGTVTISAGGASDIGQLGCRRVR